LENTPSSVRFESTTFLGSDPSAGSADCGRISHSGAVAGSTVFHQSPGYWEAEAQPTETMNAANPVVQIPIDFMSRRIRKIRPQITSIAEGPFVGTLLTILVNN
jgi:hypothetical protein